MGLLWDVIPHFLHCILSSEVENNYFSQLTDVELIYYVYSELIFGTSPLPTSLDQQI